MSEPAKKPSEDREALERAFNAALSADGRDPLWLSTAMRTFGRRMFDAGALAVGRDAETEGGVVTWGDLESLALAEGMLRFCAREHGKPNVFAVADRLREWRQRTTGVVFTARKSGSALRAAGNDGADVTSEARLAASETEGER